MYQPRSYRGGMNRERFRFFRVVHHESDLLIGVTPSCFRHEMKELALEELVRLRLILLEQDLKDPRFFSSLDPLEYSGPEAIPEEITHMLACGKQAGTGPMAAVAGLFAERVGTRLLESFHIPELVVENGGDLFLKNEAELNSVIHAGDAALSDKMAFVMPPGTWGICTSSGTLGHSFSLGKADAVTVISDSAPLADAWATALANQVQGPGDIEPLLERIEGVAGIDGCAVIAGDRIGARGMFQLKLLSSD